MRLSSCCQALETALNDVSEVERSNDLSAKKFRLLPRVALEEADPCFYGITFLQVIQNVSLATPNGSLTSLCASLGRSSASRSSFEKRPFGLLWRMVCCLESQTWKKQESVGGCSSSLQVQFGKIKYPKKRRFSLYSGADLRLYIRGCQVFEWVVKSFFPKGAPLRSAHLHSSLDMLTE